MKQLKETVTRSFADLHISTTENFLFASLTDTDDKEKQHFCMVAGGPYPEAYVGVYQDGHVTPEGNTLPYALTETGLQVPRGKTGLKFLTFEEIQKLLDFCEDLGDEARDTLEFLKATDLDD